MITISRLTDPSAPEVRTQRWAGALPGRPKPCWQQRWHSNPAPRPVAPHPAKHCDQCTQRSDHCLLAQVHHSAQRTQVCLQGCCGQRAPDAQVVQRNQRLHRTGGVGGGTRGGVSRKRHRMGFWQLSVQACAFNLDMSAVAALYSCRRAALPTARPCMVAWELRRRMSVRCAVPSQQQTSAINGCIADVSRACGRSAPCRTQMTRCAPAARHKDRRPARTRHCPPPPLPHCRPPATLRPPQARCPGPRLQRPQMKHLRSR